MDTKQIIRTFIENEILQTEEPDSIAFDQDLLLSGLLDSLGVIRLATFLEERFEITIPPQDVVIDHFMSIDAVAAYLDSREVVT